MRLDPVEWIAVCVAALSFLGATQVNNIYKLPADVSAEFANVYSELQPRQFTIYRTTPTAPSIRNGEIVIVSTNSVNLVTKIDGVVTALTKN